jgi:hypothetical protein
MQRLIPILTFSLSVAACDTSREPATEALAFRDASLIDVAAPAANAPVVATLVPGAPFKFGGGYGFVKAPGVGPNMARFSVANVGTIPALDSGDIIAVKRGAQTSRVRLVGVSPEGLVFVPQAGSPFTHAFAPVPWSAWGAAAATVQTGAAAIAEEWFACVEEVGEGSWCSEAADDELAECASGQGCAFVPEFGGTMHVEFECLLPAPHSMTVMGEEMNMGGCDGEFTGTITQEPGDMGCEDVYNGTWTANNGGCNAGPADVIVLSDQPGA